MSESISFNALRLSWPDAFKLLAITGVILIHLPARDRFDQAAWQSVEAVQTVFGWAVIGFFAIAGILYHDNGRTSARDELRRRARRLLVPWLAFTLLYKVAVSVLAWLGMIRNYSWPADSDAANLVSWLMSPADPQLYFLLYLFGIQAVVILLHRISPMLVAGSAVAGGLIWLSYTAGVSSYVLLHGGSLSLVPIYFAYFAAGVLCGSSQARLGICLGVFGVVAIVLFLTNRDVVLSAQVLIPWLLLFLFRAGDRTALMKCLGVVGRLAGVVYVWHAPLVIAGCALACVAIVGDGIAGVIATVVSTFVLSAVIGVAVNRAPTLKAFHI
jgi:fucose 4-O-acetylase-like acetyltransferase